MDMLAGYASDASGSSENQEAAAPIVQTAPALPSWAAESRSAQPPSLLKDLPAPSSQPKRAKRRTLPMTLQYVPDSDEEVSAPGQN